VDTDNATSSAQALVVFRNLAREFGCAVLLLRHLTKTSREKALYRGQGSIAFAGVARIVIACGRVPGDEDTRAIAVSKLNIGAKPKALTYTIKAKPTLKDSDASEFKWGDYVDLNAEQLIGSVERKSHGELDDAIALLERTLIKGPTDKRQLEELAADQGLSWTTVKRAAKLLGVKFNVAGFGRKKRSVWEL
jgi:DNA repair protein RadA/Sms